MACGQMALNIEYFYSLTPRQFFNIQKGWSDRRETEMNERLILTRRLMYASLAPYSKGLTEEGLWPLEIDKVHNRTEAEDQIMAQELQESIEWWDRIDAIRAKA